MSKYSKTFDQNELMSADEIMRLEGAKFGHSVGLGNRLALLIIDAQQYMMGTTEPDDETEYPSACPGAKDSMSVIKSLSQCFREAGQPVIYTRMEVRRDGKDMGVNLLVRGMLQIEGWYIEGTKGATIPKDIQPHDEDIVLRKTKFSAFHGTPLLDYLISESVDTVVITGGSTSNCVRATAVDACSHNFRTIVVRDGVFDRIQLSHEVNLMDIDRQVGDVVHSQDVVRHLQSIAP